MLTALLRVVRWSFLFVSLLAFLDSCKKSDISEPAWLTSIDVDTSVSYVFGNQASVDIDADGVDDITFSEIGDPIGMFVSGGSSRIDAVSSGIAFLADSFDYYYCCDTAYDTTHFVIDTIYCSYNCASTDTFCTKTTRAYAVVKPDFFLPDEGFYRSNSVNLYLWQSISAPHGYPPGGVYKPVSIAEGDFREYPAPGFIFLRWKIGDATDYYAIETEWAPWGYYYIKRVYKLNV